MSKPAFWKQVAAYYTDHGAPYEWKDLRRTYRALCAAETDRLQRLYPDVKIEIEARHGSSIMAYEGYKLAAQGVTSVEEVERVTFDMEHVF